LKDKILFYTRPIYYLLRFVKNGTWLLICILHLQKTQKQGLFKNCYQRFKA